MQEHPSGRERNNPEQSEEQKLFDRINRINRIFQLRNNADDRTVGASRGRERDTPEQSDTENFSTGFPEFPPGLEREDGCCLASGIMFFIHPGLR